MKIKQTLPRSTSTHSYAARGLPRLGPSKHTLIRLSSSCISSAPANGTSSENESSNLTHPASSHTHIHIMRGLSLGKMVSCSLLQVAKINMTMFHLSSSFPSCTDSECDGHGHCCWELLYLSQQKFWFIKVFVSCIIKTYITIAHPAISSKQTPKRSI